MLKENFFEIFRTIDLGLKIKNISDKKYLYIYTENNIKLYIKLNNNIDIKENYIYIKKNIIYSTFIKFLKKKLIESYMGFYIDLLIKGIGYTVYKYNNYLYFNLGFSHYISIKVPYLLKVLKFKKRLVLYSFDKNIINRFVSKLYKFRGLDIYKGQGIVNKSKKINLKEGKKKK